MATPAQAHPEPIVKNADMNDIMIEFSKSTATKAFAECKREVDVAAYLRTEFDREFGMTWNVIVGRHFGSDVTHEAKRYINFQIGQLSILIWKS
ncbi:Dynein light chain [Plasmodiophora brassicae]|uniref:Dynein light chain n=1 Tax=Plasmodiophora brassicae TaxID=37360 RepID=A0A0G4IP96_PLABS|nr:hypothetical protein PBRA_005603 [Plasmodiophora brassicae]SPR00980.1 unnamed protein product [Plasmodiophora brassicae]